MVLLQRKLYFSKDPEGAHHFQGVQIFSRWGPNANFYRNPYNLIFQGGTGPPIPPLDLHLKSLLRCSRIRSF